MNMKLIAGGALTSLVLTGGFAGMVSAQSAASSTGLTEEQLIELALAEVPGDVSEIEQENEDGMDVVEITILDADGIETEVTLVAQTGEILEVEADDDDEDHDEDEDEDDDA